MKVTARTTLDAPAERVWREACRPELLQYVAWPMQRFSPLDPPQFPETWIEGPYEVRLLFGGVLPMGRHTIKISYPDSGQHKDGIYKLRDNGHGQIISVWDHLITISQRADGRTDYVDEVEIRADLLTLGVRAFAWVFYRHRQNRWRRLVARNFDYSG